MAKKPPRRSATGGAEGEVGRSSDRSELNLVRERMRGWITLAFVIPLASVALLGLFFGRLSAGEEMKELLASLPGTDPAYLYRDGVLLRPRRAISTPGSPVTDSPPMPEPSSMFPIRAHRRNAKGAEFALNVDARGGPTIATVALLAAAVLLLRWWLS